MLYQKMLQLLTQDLLKNSKESKKKDASKAGRIPNSIHINWDEAIYFNGNHALKSIETLAEFYAKN